MSSETIKAISSVDIFHKNCSLLFEDIVATIKSKTISDNTIDLLRPEGNYWVWDSKSSEHLKRFSFKHNGSLRFMSMFVKIKEESLQSNSTAYKMVCNELEIDPLYPLIIVYGLLQPRDVDLFKTELNQRRNWIDNTIMLNVPDDIVKQMSHVSSYSANKVIERKTLDEANSWYCQQSTIKIRPLLSIKDSSDIQNIVDDFLCIDCS